MARCEKVAPAIHLPFQSGNTRVLAAMNRRYTREQYLAKVEALRARIPRVVLTSDVIVGFPGETVQEFEDTLSRSVSTPCSPSSTLPGRAPRRRSCPTR